MIIALAIVCLVALLGVTGKLPEIFGDPVKSQNGDMQGNSPSVPDDDGIGANKGLPGPDKPPQGHDGNNGCGNDPDFEDDNNDNCFGRIRADYPDQ